MATKKNVPTATIKKGKAPKPTPNLSTTYGIKAKGKKR